MLNDNGFISKSSHPFSTACLRELLQNRTYRGYVKYPKCDQHGNGRRSWPQPVQWIEGKREAVISKGPFEKCQDIQATKAKTKGYFPKYRVIVLRDILYCAECVTNMPEDVQDDAVIPESVFDPQLHHPN